MGFPRIETIKAFVEICKKDGFEELMDEFLSKELLPEYKPVMSYLKKIVTDMLEEDLNEEANYYTSGFISCFDMFRRQIEGEHATLEDLELQIENMLGWTKFLEDENITLKNKLSEYESKR
jgi:hypothetical protein